jgi:hypothetical protein
MDPHSIVSWIRVPIQNVDPDSDRGSLIFTEIYIFSLVFEDRGMEVPL